jgi:hypothetical protein
MKERKYFMMKRPSSEPQVIAKVSINISLLMSAIAVAFVAAAGLVMLKVWVPPQADSAIFVILGLVVVLTLIYAGHEFLHIPLFLLAIVVALVTIVAIVLLLLNILESQINVLVPVAVVLGLLLALAYASHELFIAVTAPEQDKEDVSRTCKSAFGGASLLGLGAALLAFVTRQDTLLFVAALICLVSVICLVVFIIRGRKPQALDSAQ